MTGNMLLKRDRFLVDAVRDMVHGDNHHSSIHTLCI
jgi:hypothetical protein